MASLLNKTVLVTLLCLILIGQSVASVTMFYNMAAMTLMNGTFSHDSAAMKSMSHCQQNMSSNDLVVDDHKRSNSSAHTMPTIAEHHSSESLNSESSEQCCTLDCQCLTGSCSTVSAFSKAIAYTAINTTSVRINAVKSNTMNQTLPSLYRPPILG